MGAIGVSNHQPHDCLLSPLFKRRSKKTPKLCVTALCVGNSSVTSEFPALRTSNAENVSIWWRLHVESEPIYPFHYSDVIMGVMASQITSLTIVYSTVYSGSNQRKLQSSASLTCVWRIHWWPVNSPHKGPVTRKMFPFDDVIINPMLSVVICLPDAFLWHNYSRHMLRRRLFGCKSSQLRFIPSKSHHFCKAFMKLYFHSYALPHTSPWVPGF